MNHLLEHNHMALLFFPALLLTLWLTPVAIRNSYHLNAVDHPGERKVHRRAVSRLGGAAMALGVVLPLCFFVEMGQLLAGFLAGLAIVTLTGLADDILHIPPYAKFVGEVSAAAAFIWISGVSIEEFGDLVGTGDLSVGWLSPALTVFCMVGVMNALNLADGLDGLAGGISAIACVFLGLLSYQGWDWDSLNILLVLLGAIFGFLRYNTYPANLFMGDAGSLLLGYSLSAVAVIMVRNNGPGAHISPVTAAAVLALPITDTLLVMARRLRRGQHPFYPDRSHLHHRLLDLGFPHAAVVPILYVSMAAFGAQAWLLEDLSDWVQFVAVIGLAAAVHGGVFVLERMGFRWGQKEPHRRSVFEDAYSWIAHVMGKSVPVAGWVIALGLSLPVFLLPDIPRPYGRVALAAMVFIGALFPWRSVRARSSVCYGLLYLACLCLLALLQAVPGRPHWFPGYLAVLSGAVLIWVLLKMRYRGHREIVEVSAFETLLFGIALFVPLFLVPALGLGAGLRKMLLAVCLESVAFLLAMKILIRRRSRLNYRIAVALIAALALIWLKGMVFRETLTNFVSAPAGAAAPPPPPTHDPLAPPFPFPH